MYIVYKVIHVKKNTAKSVSLYEGMRFKYNCWKPELSMMKQRSYVYEKILEVFTIKYNIFYGFYI